MPTDDIDYENRARGGGGEDRVRGGLVCRLEDKRMQVPILGLLWILGNTGWIEVCGCRILVPSSDQSVVFYLCVVCVQSSFLYGFLGVRTENYRN